MLDERLAKLNPISSGRNVNWYTSMEIIRKDPQEKKTLKYKLINYH